MKNRKADYHRDKLPIVSVLAIGMTLRYRGSHDSLIRLHTRYLGVQAHILHSLTNADLVSNTKSTSIPSL